MKAKQARSTGEIRLWCAASSTGQEPYTILMTLLETVPNLLPNSIKFLASDIDRDVLSRAANGVYAEADVKDVSPALRHKYFNPFVNKRERAFRVRESYRQMISFAQVNLTSKPYPFQHKFDVVFCRNVLIYFERDLALEVTARLMNAVAPGGYLFLGHSESGLIKGDGFKSIASAVYQKNP